MRRWGVIVALIGVLGAAGVAVAHEGEGGHDGGMPPAMKAVKDKYQGRKEQLHNECKQKMQALEQEEHSEMQAAMKADHDKRMQEMEGKYQQHMQEKQQKREEHLR